MAPGRYVDGKTRFGNIKIGTISLGPVTGALLQADSSVGLRQSLSLAGGLAALMVSPGCEAQPLHTLRTVTRICRLRDS